MRNAIDNLAALAVLLVIATAFLAAAAWTTVLPSIGLLWLAGLL